MNFPGQAHELTFTCFNGYELLSKDRTRQWFVEALDRARRKDDLHLWAYVIMPDHAHVLLIPEHDEYQMSEILKTIKQSVSRRAINFLKKKDPDWLERLTVRPPCGRVEHRFWLAGGGYDRNIVTMKALTSSIYYIHANPVRRGLVASPTDWEWSSARWYEGEDDVKLPMDATVHLLGM